jgi:hypothetical protein
MNHSMLNAGFSRLLASAGVDSWIPLENVPDGKTYELFFLSTYCPDQVCVWNFYADAFTIPYIGVEEWRQSQITPVSGILGANGIFTPDVALLVNPRLSATGHTLTNNVEVYGFYSVITLSTRSIADAQGTIDAEYYVDFRAMGGSVRLDPFTVTTVGGVTTNHQSVFIPEEDYTQAMADNNNVFELHTFGAAVLTGHVAGLYHEVGGFGP